MENEEVLSTNSATETEPTTVTTTVETEKVEKTYTQAEVDKMIQSEKSKAKYAMLQEFGVKDVNDYRSKVDLYNAAIEENKSLKNNNSEYEKKINELNETITLQKMNVNDNFKEDVLTLARAKVSESVSFDDAVKQVLDRNPYWSNTSIVKMGTEKSSLNVEDEQEAARRQAILRRAGL